MMKRSLYLTLFLLVLVSGALATTARAEGRGFYPDGTLKWEYLFQNGEIREAKWYNEAGVLVSREIYASGKPEKTEGYRADGSLEWQVRQLADNRQDVTRFDVNGQLAARYQMAGEQMEGEYTTFHANGKAKQVVTYKNGALNGPAKTFFETGQLEHEFAYRDGQVDGPYRSYSAEGKLLSEYTFKAGQLQ